MGFRSGNRILDALPAAGAERLAPHARVLSLERGQPTTQHDTVMQCVDFPLTALMSVSGTLESGTTYELASVGAEGFVEIDAALDSRIALRSASCQFPGDVVRMPIDRFQAALEDSRPFARLVRRAVRARVFVTEQSEMCNLRHTIAERLARWLLVARERLRRDDFRVTHEFLATILGTRRAGVSEAAAVLQARGAIVYRRGNVAIGDLEQLVNASCECYAVCRAAIEETFAADRER
jgi:Crp-like helix-turn-helix domain